MPTGILGGKFRPDLQCESLWVSVCASIGLSTAITMNMQSIYPELTLIYHFELKFEFDANVGFRIEF